MIYDIYQKITELKSQNIDMALCTVIASKGSTPRKAGSKMIVTCNGDIFGTIGGGLTEQKTKEAALEVIKQNKPVVFSFALNEKNDMLCGGLMDIFIEPVETKMRLYIFGAGHIGQKLAPLAYQLGFDVTVIDEREGIFEGFDQSINITHVNKNYKVFFSDMVFDNKTFIAAISHLHDYDRDIIAYCAKQKFAYLGMIGSKRKIAKSKELYLANNILSEDEMAVIDWPMGVEISCQTPDEIAVSILAKLIDVRGKIQSS